MLEFKYDTQLLIEGKDLDEDEISDYFTEHFKGDCLLAVGDEELIKIHFHTNEPWDVLAYCSTIGEIYDIVIEDMDRQTIQRAEGIKHENNRTYYNSSVLSDLYRETAFAKEKGNTDRPDCAWQREE